MKRYLTATTPWLGGKRAIAREIMRVIAEQAPPGSTILDPFMGGGAVSIAAKALGYAVSANDMSPISEAFGKVLIENDRRTLNGTVVARALTTEPGDDVELPSPRELSLPENCREMLRGFVSYERDVAQGMERWLMRAWIAKTAITMAHWGMPTMGAGRREWDELTPGQAQQLKRTGKPRQTAKKVIESINAGVHDNGEVCTMHRGDAVEFIGQAGSAQVCYLDPPYPGVTDYETAYAGVIHLLEPEADTTPSPWSAEDGWKLLAGIFDAAQDVDTWVVSQGKGADPEAIAEMMTERGREPTWRSLSHRHLPALRGPGEGDGDELLIVGTRT